MPPQLSLHVASGHASVGPAGEVLVYPGSIFHIDCLFDRRKGNPQWTLSKPGKKYATGEINFSKKSGGYMSLKVVQQPPLLSYDTIMYIF